MVSHLFKINERARIISTVLYITVKTVITVLFAALSWQFCPICPTMAVLHWQSCAGSPVSYPGSPVPCPGSPVVAILSGNSYPGVLVLAGLPYQLRW